MEHFSSRRWTTIPAPSVSYSVLEGKKIASAVSVLFLKLIYYGASTVVHLLLLKFTMAAPVHANIYLFSATPKLWKNQKFLFLSNYPKFGQDFLQIWCSKYFSLSPSDETLQLAWPDLAKFRHFGNNLQVFGKFLPVYFYLGKMLSQVWKIYWANGQMLKNNLTIWSHWLQLGTIAQTCSFRN